MTSSHRIRRVHVRFSAQSLLVTLGTLVLLLASTVGAGMASAQTIAPALVPGAGASSAATHPSTVRANDITDNYTCQEVNTTVCVSWGGTGYDVVPSFGNTTSNTLPDPNSTLTFYIKSRFAAVWNGAPTGNSNETPIRINVTGVLWNGAQFMSGYDGTIWHANGANAYWSGPDGGVTNTSYPYWYTVVINGLGPNSVSNFFPGEYVTWQIYLVAKTPQGVLSHFLSPFFHYRLASAWAYSPHPGAVQYGGPNASSLDLSISQTPLQPNWNDTVAVTIATTDADNFNRVLIGNAVILANETSPTGTLIASTVFPFNFTIGIGEANVHATIPATWSQLPGSTVRYTVEAWDNPLSRYTPDEIIAAPDQYTVGGNGSFVTDVFSDDLAVTTSPASIENGLLPGPVLDPNTTVSLLLTSRNQPTAIQAAVIDFTFDQPSIHTVTTGVWTMSRINSTNFKFRVPSLPMGGYLNFSILAWDYNDTLEVSPYFGYSITTFDSLVPTVPQNLGFLWVYVYDNGSHSWVNGATVAFSGASNYVRITTHTMFGVAYPNASSEPSYPLLLTANVTYVVTVDDPWYVLAGAHSTQNVTYSIVLKHTMGYEGTLVQTSNYTVFEEGQLLFFWLNSTGAGPAYSQSAAIQPVALAPAIGILAAVAAILLVIPWWRDIAARRREQERKVTL
jgi:hypothetical protein